MLINDYSATRGDTISAGQRSLANHNAMCSQGFENKAIPGKSFWYPKATISPHREITRFINKPSVNPILELLLTLLQEFIYF